MNNFAHTLPSISRSEICFYLSLLEGLDLFSMFPIANKRCISADLKEIKR